MRVGCERRRLSDSATERAETDELRLEKGPFSLPKNVPDSLFALFSRGAARAGLNGRGEFEVTLQLHFLRTRTQQKVPIQNALFRDCALGNQPPFPKERTRSLCCWSRAFCNSRSLPRHLQPKTGGGRGMRPASPRRRCGVGGSAAPQANQNFTLEKRRRSSETPEREVGAKLPRTYTPKQTRNSQVPPGEKRRGPAVAASSARLNPYTVHVRTPHLHVLPVLRVSLVGGHYFVKTFSAHAFNLHANARRASLL